MNDLGLFRIQPLLDELHTEAETNDGPVLEEMLEAVVQRGAESEAEVADVLASAFIPIDPANGRLLHMLATARRPGRIVEFGTSMGLSTIYLASALTGTEKPVVTTELETAKAERAGVNLERAGLSLRAEVLTGDAFETLADFSEPISLLFLDGWKDLYLPMLKLLEPLLVDGAFVVADDTVLFAQACAPLLSYLRDPGSRYATVAIEVGDGIEIASKLAA